MNINSDVASVVLFAFSAKYCQDRTRQAMMKHDEVTSVQNTEPYTLSSRKHFLSSNYCSVQQCWQYTSA